MKNLKSMLQFSHWRPQKRASSTKHCYQKVLEVWCNADVVCFDMDSTVCLDEGIDELVEFCGAGKAVAEWTARAMSGSIPFEDALAARLSLFNPSIAQVQDFLEKRPPSMYFPVDHIFANQLLFGSAGEFLGFDTDEPTSRSGGKAIAVQQIRKANGYKSLVMIGDGATDLVARKPGGADLFICYAGVQLREAVAAKADWLVFNFKDLIDSLE
ncbi:phosphoserine phosphatase, chloroplastic-like [Coffea eugenioides]|uniref:phosphoserine phosphatase, chloroplastic-like n=1 Tax=Coffea eugenioides TaxID=49369 RepID=UPI000F604858|nr:phosphoserine phosphatase, chloroplastic-like [Coffea eugenioides]